MKYIVLLFILSGCLSNAERCVDLCIKQDMVVDSYANGNCKCVNKGCDK